MIGMGYVFDVFLCDIDDVLVLVNVNVVFCWLLLVGVCSNDVVLVCDGICW